MNIRTGHIRFHFVAHTLFFQMMSRNDFSLKPSAAHSRIEDFCIFNDAMHITMFCLKICTEIHSICN